MRADRRRVLAAAALLGLSAWVPGAAAMRALGADEAARIADLIRRMTLAEKVGQMTQVAGGRQKSLNSKLDAAMLDRVRRGEVGSFLHVAGAAPLRKLQRVAVRESRLKIPLLFAMDVIHGYSTIFPVPLALASSWDPATMEGAARAAADEAWAAGLHWTFSPMVDIARDPRWGRVVEGAGEDPYLGSRLAEAQVRGYQGTDLASGRRVMACVKHFAGYGAAIGGRDYDSAELSDRTLNEVYLPPFWAAAKAGAGSFMTAFNDIAGVPATANAELVRGTLRGAWGYQGLIVSDWNAIKELINHGVAETPAEAAALALRAGVDMDMTSNTYAEHLTEAVQADPSLLPLIDEAVGRILAAKTRLGLFDRPYGFGDAARKTAVSDMEDLVRRGEAQEAAAASIVLVRNDDGLLPIAPGKRVALIGALADDASSALGSWRARGQATEVVTLRTAIANFSVDPFQRRTPVRVAMSEPRIVMNELAEGPPITVEYQPGVAPRSDDVSGIPAAVEAAKRADVVVLVVGEDYDYTGEARSRASLDLPGPQQALIDAVKAVGKPIVAIVMSGRPLALEAALAGIPAVLVTWFLGVESGPAIVEVLTGLVTPGGKLPIGFPRTTGQVPIPYAHLPTGRPADPDLKNDSARYHDVAIGPLWPFGHGLSYTRFDYGPLDVSGMRVSVSVTNSGKLAGVEVVQLYINDPVASIERPVKELRGFARLTLQPGQTRRVTFTLTPDQFAIWKTGKWVVEPGRINVMVGSSSEDIRGTGAFEIKEGGLGSAPAAAIETRVDIA